MMESCLLNCLVILSVITAVSCFGAGAPTSACGSLMPGHTGITPQTTLSLYTLTASSTTYSPNEEISVTISGGDLGGLLVQARISTGATVPLGTFSNAPTNTKMIMCTADNDAWTHSNTVTKNNVTITWTAPATDSGSIKFVGTVAQNRATYWLNHESGTLTFKAAEGGNSAAGNKVGFWAVMSVIIMSLYSM